MRKEMVVAAIVLGIGYAIAADPESLPREELTATAEVVNPEPDQAVEPPQEEPILTDELHPAPVDPNCDEACQAAQEVK